MPTYVVDTSVIIQWFNYSQEKHVVEAKKIWTDLQTGKISIILPSILPLELLNALVKGKNYSSEKSYLVLAAFFKTQITIAEISLPVLEIAAGLMEQYRFASYDAYFLALAKYEDCKLISDDQKSHGKIKDGSVVMLENYK